jgi:hypothetical protein
MTHKYEFGKDHYDSLPSGYPYEWHPAAKNDHPHDNRDYHVDLGGGRLPKARFNIDHKAGKGVDYVLNLDDPGLVLPFEKHSVRGIITHHTLEHIGIGFPRLMEECYRVLVPGEWMRIIVPLFPSHSAVADYDHKRYFLQDTFIGFTGNVHGAVWSDGFAERYNNCNFKIIAEDYSPDTPIELMWKPGDSREMRITLEKYP